MTVNGSAVNAGPGTVNTGNLSVVNGSFNGTNGAVMAGDVGVSGGTLLGSTGTFDVSGNWSHSGGTFKANAGTVTLTGGDQSINGNTTFNNLTKTVAAVHTLTFTANDETTVSGALTLQGAAGKLLSLRSSVPGTQWKIDPQSTAIINFVDVEDSDNVEAKAINAANSVSSGNNTNWFDTLTAGAASVTASTEGVSQSTLTASFSDSNTAAPLSDYTGTVNWGDGSTASPDITPFTSSNVSGNGGSYTVGVAHQYTEEGKYAVAITVNDAGGTSTSLSARAQVNDAALSAGTASATISTEGVSASTLTATFSDANPAAAASDFNATINWGDNQTSTGTVLESKGVFTVVGTHTYSTAGMESVTVSIDDKGGASTTKTTTAVVSAPAPFKTADAAYVIGSGTASVSAAQGLLANEQEITSEPEYATNPPQPADGMAAPLNSYYKPWTASSAQSQAAVAAKDALFSRL